MRGAILLVGVLAVPQGGAFTPGSPVNVGRGSGTLLLADINGDGRKDLLANHLQSKRLTIHFGDGRGGFTASSPLDFDFDPAGPLLVDFNKDGHLDLAVTQGARDVVHVFKGSGKGTFERTATYAVTGAAEPYNKRTMHAVDVNGDGHVDLVTANGRRRNTIGILFGNGRGGFTQGPEVPVDEGRDGYSVAFGDLNGDRHLDVVSTGRVGFDDRGPGRIMVHFGNGQGQFARSPQSPFETTRGPRATWLHDFNNDRRPDLAVLNVSGQLSIYLNDGAGKLAGGPPPFELGVETYFPVIDDVNGDGAADLVLPNVKSVAVFLRNGANFIPAPGSPFAAGPGSYAAAVGDVNGDGKPDVIASSFEGDAVAVLLRR
jgi:hypothetical protein